MKFRLITFLLIGGVLLIGLPTPIGASTTPSPIDRSSQLAAQFKRIIGYRKLAVSVIPITPVHGVAETGYQADQQYPVASAFKGAVAIYFFENVDPLVWRGVPIPYWEVTNPAKIPAEYRAAWDAHQAILFDMHQMAVLSENDATGRVLAYVYRTTPMKQMAENPLRAFNDWSREHVGIGEKSGLRAWLVGDTLCPHCYDSRLEAQPMIYAKRIFYLNNTYTPRDLALYYVYLATEGRRLGYFDAAEALMSAQHYGMIRRSALHWNIKTITKDGYIAPDSANGNGYRISTDAGLLTLPDGEEYAVAFMAFDSGDLLEPSISAMDRILIESQRAEF